MIRPGPLNLITDVPGLAVGNAEDPDALTGVTVLLPENRAACAVDVRGGAPGTRETDLLRPDCLVDAVDGLVLSGGSAFGLAAADGVMAWLSARGRGFPVGGRVVPVVPAAILFDLNAGGEIDWREGPPYRRLGQTACERVGREFALGNAGAGLGARAGGLKGGLGSASAAFSSEPGDLAGLVVGALVAVNAYGSPVIPGTIALWAWPFEESGEMGGQVPPPRPVGASVLDLDVKARAFTNTTLAIVATNAALDKAALGRVAVMAQDGLARSLRPAHTPFDGDAVFALSTARLSPPPASASPHQIAAIGAVAADCLARAVGRAIYEARSVAGIPAYRDWTCKDLGAVSR